ncbi:MAG: hypothetical protein M3552_20415 [Planctomycetota bacterium]|nr:hypothetical protein [Planctomycetota bacterium]
MNEELAAEGITYRQGQVLAWLAFDGDLAQCDLAERMSVEPPSLKKHVSFLGGHRRDGVATLQSKRRPEDNPTRSLREWQMRITRSVT